MLPTRSNQVFGEFRVVGFIPSPLSFVTVRDRIAFPLNCELPKYCPSTINNSLVWDIPTTDHIERCSSSFVSYLELLFYPHINRSGSKIGIAVAALNAGDISTNYNPYTRQIESNDLDRRYVIIPSLLVQFVVWDKISTRCS